MSGARDVNAREIISHLVLTGLFHYFSCRKFTNRDLHLWIVDRLLFIDDPDPNRCFSSAHEKG